jgi:hypothetical protein
MTGGPGWALACALVGAACGRDTTADGLNAPCTRTSDCIDGLQCLGGFCHSAEGDAGSDGGPSADAGTSDGASGD